MEAGGGQVGKQMEETSSSITISKLLKKFLNLIYFSRTVLDDDGNENNITIIWSNQTSLFNILNRCFYKK